MIYDVLIVGAGHGGAQAAIALRQVGFVGTMALVGEEADPPYERPPLSKEYLAREKPFERILIRPRQFWADRNVDLLLARRIVSVSPEERTVTCADGGTLSYGKLIWATGGAPRRMACSGHDLRGIHAIRTREDVDRVMSELTAVERVVVIGAGYIGLEAAAVLRKFGKSVVVLETRERVLARVAGAELSRFYEAEHKRHGVEIRLGATVDCIRGADGQVQEVALSTGETIAADMVIVGIGIEPAVKPLIAAGASGTSGVDVDEQCRTTIPDIFAIGDCAAHFNPFAGEQRVRVESVQNANDQATVAAKCIVGRDEAYRATPWFWSNQYDLKLQTVGIAAGHDEEVVRGDIETRSFSIIYLKRGRVVALDCVNAVKDYVQGRKLVEAGCIVGLSSLSDVTVPLKELA